MRRRITVALAIVLLACIVAVAAGAPSTAPTGRRSTPPTPRWKINGCSRPATARAYHRTLRHVMRSPRVTRRQLRHLAGRLPCAYTAASARAMRRHYERWKAWRHSYAASWWLAWRRLPAAGQGWTLATSRCETRRWWPDKAAMARAATGNGFLGAFQWMASTWGSAGGDRPVTAATWYHQAVLAWGWHLGHGSGQWPNCGE